MDPEIIGNTESFVPNKLTNDGWLYDIYPELRPDFAGQREKQSTGSAQAESGFIPEGAIGKTVGLSYEPEAQ